MGLGLFNQDLALFAPWRIIPALAIGLVFEPLGTPTAAPDWQLSFPLPNARPLVGLEIALQAYYVGTNTPLGYDLTNGLWTRLGY